MKLKTRKYAFPEDKNSCVLNANIVGKSANEIAKEAGFEVPEKQRY